MSELVAAARDIAGLAAEQAEAGDAERRLARPVVDAMSQAGLYRALVPASVGGGEVEPQAFLDSIEALAGGDAAAGWVIAVCGTGGMLGAYLQPDAASEVYGDPGAIVGGVFAPRGRAVPDGDGFVVTGRWPFSSHCQDCTSLMGGCLVADGDDVARLPGGGPDIRLFLFPAGEFEVHDTWHVAGLRATGSHDISLEGARVPAARGASLITDPPVADGPLYAFPPFGLLALSVGAVGLGVAAAAIGDLVELAGGKTPTGSARTLAQRADAQSRVAKAQATVDSARALMRTSVGEAWEQARAQGAVGVPEKAALRRAATHAITASAQAVDSMYDLAGGTAVYERSPLQRRHRDIHVATQHMLVGPGTWELAGRVALGVETETSQL